MGGISWLDFSESISDEWRFRKIGSVVPFSGILLAFLGSCCLAGDFSYETGARRRYVEQPIDASTLAELLDEHAARLEFYASQWTVAPDDCVQEAFMSLAALAEAPNEAVPWLYHVVRKRAMNAARSLRRRSHHESIASWLGKQCSREPLSKEDCLSLPEALDKLPATEREIVVLRIWSELTWQQIAELVGTSSSSVHRTYVAALTKMKQQLEPPCPDTIPCRQT
jgi:RNA polymerase sigma factor (sigma-70 family)